MSKEMNEINRNLTVFATVLLGITLKTYENYKPNDGDKAPKIEHSWPLPVR